MLGAKTFVIVINKNQKKVFQNFSLFFIKICLLFGKSFIKNINIITQFKLVKLVPNLNYLL